MLAFAEGSNAAGAVSSVTIIHDEHKDPNVSRRNLLPGEDVPGPNFVNIAVRRCKYQYKHEHRCMNKCVATVGVRIGLMHEAAAV